MKKYFSICLSVILIFYFNITTFALTTESTVLNSYEEDKFVVEYVDSIIADSGKTIRPIEVKTVYDLIGTTYKVIECTPTGYFIMQPDTGIMVEHSFSSVSPFDGKQNNIFYFGPLSYYELINNEYVHIFSGNVIPISNNEEIEEKNRLTFNNYVKDKDQYAIDVINGNKTRSISSRQIGDVLVDGAEWFQNLTNYGAMDGDFCGYNQANMLLKYWDLCREEISLPGSHSTLNSDSLATALYAIGCRDEYQYGNLTIGPMIHDVLSDYILENNIPGDVTYDLRAVNSTPNEINNDRPCILFGDMYDPRDYNPRDIEHAVVVYGYNTISNSGYYTYICHYGWSGRSDIRVYVGNSEFEGFVRYNPYR